jgi:hypothetical protein
MVGAAAQVHVLAVDQDERIVVEWSYGPNGTPTTVEWTFSSRPATPPSSPYRTTASAAARTRSLSRRSARRRVQPGAPRAGHRAQPDGRPLSTGGTAAVDGAIPSPARPRALAGGGGRDHLHRRVRVRGLLSAAAGRGDPGRPAVALDIGPPPLALARRRHFRRLLPLARSGTGVTAQRIDGGPPVTVHNCDYG